MASEVFHEVRVQFHRTVPSLQLQTPGHKSSLSPGVLTDRLRVTVSSDPSWGSVHLLARFTELRETFCLSDRQFITKGENPGTGRWKRGIGQSVMEASSLSRDWSTLAIGY